MAVKRREQIYLVKLDQTFYPVAQGALGRPGQFGSSED